MMTRRTLLTGAAAVAAVRPALARTQTSSHWSRAADAPYVVQEVYPAGLDGRIYLAGGLSPAVPSEQQNISDRLVIYDLERDSWAEGPAFPEPRHHPYLVAHDGLIYAIGGYSADQGGRWSNRSTLHVLDPGDLDAGWAAGPAMPAPQAETVAVSLKGRIHVVGGRRPAGGRNAQWFDQADITAHQVFDPASGEWSISTPAPTARNSAAGAVIDGRLYIVGGRTVSGGNTDALEVFIPADDPNQPSPWEKLRPSSKSRGESG